MTIYERIIDYIFGYLDKTYTKQELCDMFNSRNKYNDSKLVANVIDEYFEREYFGFADDINAKVVVAFGREQSDDQILEKAKEYIQWAFTTEQDEDKWCYKYLLVYDDTWGVLKHVDYTEYKCIFEDDDYYVVKEQSEGTGVE